MLNNTNARLLKFTLFLSLPSDLLLLGDLIFNVVKLKMCSSETHFMKVSNQYKNTILLMLKCSWETRH